MENQQTSHAEYKALAFREFERHLRQLESMHLSNNENWFPAKVTGEDVIFDLCEELATKINFGKRFDFQLARAKVELINAIQELSIYELHEDEFVVHDEIFGMEIFDFMDKLAESERIVFTVSVYKVTRHFGGHEEGGWYYNWYNLRDYIHVLWRDVEREVERLESKYDKLKEGDIYNVSGGCEYQVFVEAVFKENQSIETPIYE